MEDLLWMGIDWDEGPSYGPVIGGGPAGSYLQSERIKIYSEYAQNLISRGMAYRCYCTKEEVEESRARATALGKPPHYDGKCRNLSPDRIRAYEKEGRVPAIRFIAYNEDFSFTDRVKGDVNFPKGMVGDFIIVRASGLPVYNFAVVVDDALMEITHVFRGDEHLSNTVRQLMLFKAMGFREPEFAHMALILGSDRQKLSKRHGATSVEEFRKLGYLPDSLVNYLSLLGWSSPDGREILPREDLVKLFDIERLASSPAIFDPAKLDWIAKHYIINENQDKIFEMALPFIKETGLVDDNYISDPVNREFLKGVVQITRGYCSCLSGLKNHIGYFLNDDYEIDPEAEKFLKKEESAIVIRKFREAVENGSDAPDEKKFVEIVNSIIRDTGIKGKNLFMPLRAALTGKPSGPEIYFLLPVIGRERTISRLDRIIKAYY